MGTVVFCCLSEGGIVFLREAPCHPERPAFCHPKRLAFCHPERLTFRHPQRFPLSSRALPLPVIPGASPPCHPERSEGSSHACRFVRGEDPSSAAPPQDDKEASAAPDDKRAGAVPDDKEAGAVADGKGAGAVRMTKGQAPRRMTKRQVPRRMTKGRTSGRGSGRLRRKDGAGWAGACGMTGGRRDWRFTRPA